MDITELAAAQQTDGNLTDAQILQELEKFDAGQETSGLDSLAKEGNQAALEQALNSEGSEGTKNPDDKTQQSEPPKPGTEAEKLAAAKLKTEEDPLAEKPGDSAFTKAQKDRQRLDKTWENVNKQKEELQAQQREIEAERAKIKQQQEELAKAPKVQGKPEPKKFSSTDYRAAAEDYRKSGELENAEAAEALALQAEQLEQAEEQKKVAEVKQRWNDDMMHVMNQDGYTELKNPDSALGKKFLEVIAKEPLFSVIPQGPHKAAWVSKAFVQAELVPGLEAKIAEQLKEIETLKGKLQIGSSYTPTGAGGQSAQQSTSESEAALLEVLKEFDAQNGITT